MPSPSEHVLQFLKGSEHLPEHVAEIFDQCGELAAKMDAALDDGPEKTVGLRKLLEAKDCFVRQRLIDRGGP